MAIASVVENMTIYRGAAWYPQVVALARPMNRRALILAMILSMIPTAAFGRGGRGGGGGRSRGWGSSGRGGSGAGGLLLLLGLPAAFFGWLVFKANRNTGSSPSKQWFDVTLTNGTDRSPQRRVVEADTPENAASIALKACRLTNPLGNWRVSQIAPVKRLT